MTDYIENENENNQQDDTNVDYIQAMVDLKNSTVSKEKYDKLAGENKKLIEALKSGGQVNELVEEQKIEPDELRKRAFMDENTSDVERLDCILKLRNYIIDNEDRDPFLPNGSGYKLDDSDVNSANKVADILQECLDNCNGSDYYLSALIGSRIKDTPLANAKKNKNKR